MWTRGIQRKGWEDAGPSGLFIGWEKAASVRAKRVVQWVGRHSKCVGQAGCSVGGWEDTASVRAKRVVQWVGRSSKRLGQAGCSVGGWEDAASVWAKRVVQWVGGKMQQAFGPSGLFSELEEAASVWAKQVVQWVGRSSKRLGQAGCSVGGEMQQLCGQGVSNVRGWKTQQACGPSGLFSGWVG